MEYLDTIAGTASAWARQAVIMDLPVPDIALLAGFGVLLFAVWANARSAVARNRARIAGLYQAELLATSRKAQRAQADLRRAELLIERERQKRRRESNRAVARPKRARAALVDMSKRTPSETLK